MVRTRLRVFFCRLLELVRRNRREARLDAEIDTYLAELTDEYVARRLSPAEARHAARRASRSSQ